MKDDAGKIHSIEGDILELIRQGKDDHAIQSSTGFLLSTIRRVRAEAAK